jgi:aspartyl-tRNA(Asn)/glutamyl-tRNA(Gln) amidotransferase subunit B
MAIAYEPVIGLEVHAQLHSRSKLFCSCSTEYGAPPNTHVCPVCLGLPGALPVPNARALEMAAQAAMALGCTVNARSRFARKNYFYPDLAKGYQISQFELPLNEKGRVDIEVNGDLRSIGITRVHVEEDAAKNLHGVGAGAQTLVDFNRAGVALIEIVSEPDLRSAEEAEAYLKRLREVLMFVGVNDGNLEEGSFRCDANVSIRPVGTEPFGTRAELKNINSFRFVRKAIDHEIARQEAVLAGGGQVVQETRTWSEGQGKTVSMRSKEEAHDYRYFPDPDLPPLVLGAELVEGFRERMPELPEAMRRRWQDELGVTAYDAGVLSAHPEIARFFDAMADALVAAWGDGAKGKAGKKAANFLQAEVLRDVTTDGLDAHFAVTAGQVAELLTLVEDGTISGKMAKDVYAQMVETGRGAKRIVDEKGLSQVTDASAIEAEVQKVLDAHPGEVDKYREGKTSLLGFFVGQVMKATRGAANPKMVNEVLRKRLSE